MPYIFPYFKYTLFEFEVVLMNDSMSYSILKYIHWNPYDQCFFFTAFSKLDINHNHPVLKKWQINNLQ